MTETRSPDQIRAEIADTRTELSNTVAALAAKTDVKARTKEAVAETTDHVKQAAADAVDQVKQTASEQARNPVPWAIIGGAVGGLVGWIVVRVRRR